MANTKTLFEMTELVQAAYAYLADQYGKRGGMLIGTPLDLAWFHHGVRYA